MSERAEVFACLYARELPAQALLRLQPEHRDCAFAVVDGEPPLQTVCALNTKARLLGVAHGMTRVELEMFPSLVVLTRSRPAETAIHNALLEAARGFSPRLEVCNEATAFLCAIDIAGTESLFGPAEALAKALLRRVRALGVSASVTVSRNFHTAVCLAKGQPRSVTYNIVRSGLEADALRSLPVSVLDITSEQAETFGLWGIHNLGMLASLPENELISRLGQNGGCLRLLARGELSHLFQPVEVPFRLEERRELDFPLDDLESLLFGVALMLDQVIRCATARILALASVSVELCLEGAPPHAVTVRPALATNDKHLWLKLLRQKLETEAPEAPILAVAVRAEAGVTSKVQLGLFSPQLPEPGRLDVTLARLAAIVGEANIGRAVLEDRNSQEAFRMEAFTVPSSDSEITSVATARASCRYLRPKERARVTVQDGKPLFLFFRERRYKVEHAYGPWRESGDWWNSTIWDFDQWDLVVRGQDGGLLCYCVMRDLMHNEWQVAALYD